MHTGVAALLPEALLWCSGRLVPSAGKLPEPMSEVHAIGRLGDSGAQPGSLHLLWGAGPGQTPAPGHTVTLLISDCSVTPSGPINQLLRLDPPRHRLAKVMIPPEPRANHVLHK